MKKPDPTQPLRVKLSPEWLGQSGLWREEEGEGFMAVDAEELGLSEDLADRLEDWTDSFDAIFDEDDPPASHFATLEEYAAFVAEGEAIAALIRRETGAEVITEFPHNVRPRYA